jgi:lysophospholipid acyltransferase (LPLAT)-like uncharacterized protein
MHKFLTIVFAFFSSLLLRFICGSNRLTVTKREVFETYVDQGNNIFVFWHSRLFYLVYYYIKNAPNRKVSILVSMSRDGDYGAALVRRLRQDAVRGSTSRGGQKAIHNLVVKLAEGNNTAITPDGPRGPTLTVNEGVIKLAQLTGARILPVSYDATRKKLLKSWDRFIVVKPFGRIHLAFSEPFEVPRHIAPGERRKYVEHLEQTLRRLDQICAEQLAPHLVGHSERASQPHASRRASVTPPQRASVR